MGRGQLSKITPQSRASLFTFLMTIGSHSLVPDSPSVCECMAGCACLYRP